jgi:hypothetical protein
MGKRKYIWVFISPDLFIETKVILWVLLKERSFEFMNNIFFAFLLCGSDLVDKVLPAFHGKYI